MESEAKPVKRRLRGKQTAPIFPPPAEEAVPLKKEPKNLRARLKPVYVPKAHESSIDPEKKEIIEKIYFDDRTGYRSVRDTWKKAREIDPSIKLKDVSQWKAELEPRKTQVSGYNSFIPKAPFQEFQVDLFFISIPSKGQGRTETATKKKKRGISYSQL